MEVLAEVGGSGSLLLRWRPTVRFYFAFVGLVDVSLEKPMGKLKVPGLEGVQHPLI